MTRTAPQLQPLTQSDLMPLPAVSCPACHGSDLYSVLPRPFSLQSEHDPDYIFIGRVIQGKSS